jgi:hypothetical protein
MGDVNWDGVINQEDVALIQAAWGSTPSSPNWNSNADLNGDGVVNEKDLAILSANYGKDIWSWLGWGSQATVEGIIIGGSLAGVAIIGALASTKAMNLW